MTADFLWPAVPSACCDMRDRVLDWDERLAAVRTMPGLSP